MIKKIINEIKVEYKRNKIRTGFMGVIVLFALLSYLKPGSTENILEYMGITAINFIVASIAIVGIWWFCMRKRK